MLTAKDVMTKDVVTVNRLTTVRELAEIFAGRKISSVPVVDNVGNLVGIVTETDLIEQNRNLHMKRNSNTAVTAPKWTLTLKQLVSTERAVNEETRKKTEPSL